MHWDYPTVLLALAILPLVGALLLSAHRHQRQAAARFALPAMRCRLLAPRSRMRGAVKGVVLLAGLALLIVAAARPRFGLYVEHVSQRGTDLLVLLDVSRSMLADDVAPNRLERAKSDIRDLLPRLSGDRIGLIAFAGKPVLKVPLTTDHDVFRMVLDELDTLSAPRGGTAIGDAIRKAVEVLPKLSNRDKALILITDGEDQGSHPEDAAREAARFGVKIFTIGLGDSQEGSRIPVCSDDGPAHYVEDAGHEHWSRLNGQLLKDIALHTKGAYIPAGTRVYDLGQIYEEHLASLSRGEIASQQREEYRERYQWFLAIGLLLVGLEMGISSYPRRHTTLHEAMP